jgi:hypothetical protein
VRLLRLTPHHSFDPVLTSLAHAPPADGKDVVVEVSVFASMELNPGRPSNLKEEFPLLAPADSGNFFMRMST